MDISRFAFPTPIPFGAGARRLVASHLLEQGVRRPLIVTDPGVRDAALVQLEDGALHGFVAVPEGAWDEIRPRLLARLSIASRPYRRDQGNTHFYSGFQRANYDTDAGRAPHLGTGALAQRNRRLIEAHPMLQGHMPRGFLTSERGRHA